MTSSLPCKVAFITGISGQDGYYLSQFLLSKGYEIHGLIRPSTRSSAVNAAPPSSNGKLFLHYGDILDLSSLVHILESVKVDEIYHLAAQSHVGLSFELPVYTTDVNALGTLRMIEAIKMAGIEKSVKFYNACSSEVFGCVVDNPQTETTQFRPLSPYAMSKAFAFWATQNFRAADETFAISGILFNHESPRRDFVTRRITIGVALIASGKITRFELGNLEAKRDWGHAKDYVRGMYEMLQQEHPDDFVLASGESHSVREFAEEAFKVAGIDLRWYGTGFDEVGKDILTSEVRISVNQRFYRPRDVEFLNGSSTKAEKAFGWKREVDFKTLVRQMVETDIELALTGKLDLEVPSYESIA